MCCELYSGCLFYGWVCVVMLVLNLKLVLYCMVMNRIVRCVFCMILREIFFNVVVRICFF